LASSLTKLKGELEGELDARDPAATDTIKPLGRTVAFRVSAAREES
jgi:hypothetical protein